MDAADGEPLWDCESSNSLCMTAPTAQHVAEHDPDRILGHIAAARARLAELTEALAAGHNSYDLASTLLPLELRPWANHPDYQQEWRP